MDILEALQRSLGKLQTTLRLTQTLLLLATLIILIHGAILLFPEVIPTTQTLEEPQTSPYEPAGVTGLAAFRYARADDQFGVATAAASEQFPSGCGHNLIYADFPFSYRRYDDWWVFDETGACPDAGNLFSGNGLCVVEIGPHAVRVFADYRSCTEAGGPEVSADWQAPLNYRTMSPSEVAPGESE